MSGNTWLPEDTNVFSYDRTTNTMSVNLHFCQVKVCFKICKTLAYLTVALDHLDHFFN